MPNCKSTITVAMCVETREVTTAICAEQRATMSAICKETRSTAYKKCAQERDDGYSKCSEWAQSRYQACSEWGKQCCDWQPCKALCRVFTSICKAWVWLTSGVCKAWVWVANVVCIAWAWMVSSVCIAWTWLVHTICVAWAWLRYSVCALWAAVVWTIVWICCSQWPPNGYANCMKSVGDMPRNPIDKPGWKLTFEDDFDAGSIDTTKWIDHVSFIGRYALDGVGVNEADFAIGRFPKLYYSQSYLFGPSTVKLVADNTPVEITIPFDPAQPNKWHGKFRVPYTVQALQWQTDPLMEQQYGYFEIRCRNQDALDMWSAFWLFPVTPDPSVGPKKTWPPEIDIFEFMARRPDVFTTTHIWGTESNTKSSAKRHGACEAGKRFHIYACEWTKDSISYYLDNQLLRTSSRGVEEFMFPMSVIASSGIRDGDCRKPELSTYPNYLEIDYIRVYSR